MAKLEREEELALIISALRMRTFGLGEAIVDVEAINDLSFIKELQDTLDKLEAHVQEYIKLNR